MARVKLLHNPLRIALILVVVIGAILAVLTPNLLGALGSAGTIIVIITLALIAISKELLPKKMKERERRKSQSRRIKRIADQFSNFLKRISNEAIGPHFPSENELLKSSEPLEKSIPELLLSQTTLRLHRDEIDCLVVLWLTFHWTRIKSSLGGPELELFHTLDGAFRSSFPTLKFTPKTKLLMIAYEKVRRSWSMSPKRRLRMLFDGDLTVERYRELLYEFLSKIGQQHLYETLRANRAETLRATLIQLITEGRLASHGLRKDLIDRIQHELRKHGTVNNVFVILKNKFYELDSYLEGLPRLKGRAVSPRGLGFPEEAKIFMTVVKTPDSYRNADHFTEVEIRPRIKTREGFLAVVPANLFEAVIFPEQKDFAGKAIVATNYDLVNFMLTGFKETDLDIWMLLAKHEVPIEEILSILPLTVLAGHLPQEATNEMWERYDEMKVHFQIRALPDWAGVSPDDLANFLTDNMPSFRSIQTNELEEICRQIVEEARRIRAALLPIQLELPI